MVIKFWYKYLYTVYTYTRKHSHPQAKQVCICVYIYIYVYVRINVMYAYIQEALLQLMASPWPHVTWSFFFGFKINWKNRFTWPHATLLFDGRIRKRCACERLTQNILEVRKKERGDARYRRRKGWCVCSWVTTCKNAGEGSFADL